MPQFYTPLPSVLSVTSAATDIGLLTRDEVSDAINDATATNTQLTTLGKRVSALITKACRVAAGAGATPPTLRLETLEETIELPCPLRTSPRTFNLSRKPVIAITSVIENGIALTPDLYRLHTGSTILERRNGGFGSSWQPRCDIVVAYSAGWDTVPDDLKQLAAQFATALWTSRGQSPSLGSENIPGVYEATYRYGRPDDPLIPVEIMDGLYRGGYVTHWVA